MQMLTGYWVSMSLHVVAKLGIADRIEDAPKSAKELAQATQTHAESLYRLLRAMSSVGVFEEDEQGKFGHTELSRLLRADHPNSKLAMAIMLGGDEHYRTWGELEYSIRTGKRAFDHLFGQPAFDWLAAHPEKARQFDEAMVSVHGIESAAICDAYDFSSFGTLVDVGGGNGSLLRIILERTPRLKGILYDLPHVVERARPKLPARCQAMGGSFFEAVPAGGDAYLMRHIIHDWEEDRCLQILGHVRRVIPSTGKLLVVEGVVPARNQPSFTQFLDLNMLVIPGGKERTESEYRELLARARFQLKRIVATKSEVSVIEGVPA
jgi:hypothetical protein